MDDDIPNTRCCRVRGDCIQCPFHNWRFSGETGRCVEAAYSSARLPDQARLGVRTSLERNGLVLVWHHAGHTVLLSAAGRHVLLTCADGEPPSWWPPVLEEVESGEWVYQGRNEFTVNCHIQVTGVHSKACNEALPKVREDFTITEKAPSPYSSLLLVESTFSCFHNFHI